jgi:hypothetical protein
MEYVRKYRIFAHDGAVKVRVYDDEGMLYGCTVVDKPVDHREAVVYAKWTWEQILGPDGWLFR